MLGLDRHWNRYWLLSGPRIRARRADDRVPIVCVETQAVVRLQACSSSSHTTLTWIRPVSQKQSNLQ